MLTHGVATGSAWKNILWNAVNITGHFIFPWCNAGRNLVINNSSRYSLIRQTFVKNLLVWRSCVRPYFLLDFILLHYPIQSIWICLALILILSWSGGGRKLAVLDPLFQSRGLPSVIFLEAWVEVARRSTDEKLLA